MKAIKIMSLAIAFSGALALSSCKGEGKSGNEPDTLNKDTVVPEGMSSRPGVDTIVERDGDTITSTKVDAPNQNPVGEQVP